MSEYNEPWAVNDDHDMLETLRQIRGSDGKLLFEIKGRRSDAALVGRVLACVNACRHLTDEQLGEVNDGKRELFVTSNNAAICGYITTIAYAYVDAYDKPRISKLPTCPTCGPSGAVFRHGNSERDFFVCVRCCKEVPDAVDCLSTGEPIVQMQLNDPPCPDCHGTGEYRGLNEVRACPTCGGGKS